MDTSRVSQNSWLCPSVTERKQLEVSDRLAKTMYSITVKTLYTWIIKTKSFHAKDLVGVHQIYIALCHRDDAVAALNLSATVLFQVFLWDVFD